MTSRARMVGAVVVILAVEVAAMGAVDAAPDPRAADKVAALNLAGVSAHKSGDHQAAKAKLLEAVVIGKENGLASDLPMARTYLHLGVVHAEGLRDQEKASRYFGLALKIQPDLGVDPTLETSAVAAAMDRARAARRAPPRVEPAAAAEPPAPAPAPAPARPPAPEPTRPPPPSDAEKERLVKERADLEKQLAAAQQADQKERDARQKLEEEEARQAAAAREQERRNRRLADGPPLPAELPEPLFCPDLDERPAGADLHVHCAAQPRLQARTFSLHYRFPGARDYTAMAMEPNRKGWRLAVVPGAQLTGKTMQYYIEARSAAGTTVATIGKANSPNIMILLPPGTAPSPPPAAAAGTPDAAGAPDATPPARMKKARTRPPRRPTSPR